MRFLGLDVGTKRIGVAVSDELGLFAQALTTIERESIAEDLNKINGFVEEWKVHKVVVGLPKRTDGRVGKEAERVLKFSESLQKKLKVPVDTWDERFSTVAATRTLLEANLSRAKRKKVVDKLAAVFILQGYLESISRN
jgi:putative Holliday junction resolvase